MTSDDESGEHTGAREPFEWDSMGFETTFVENMQVLRERRGMSQTAFGKRMQEHGHGWHQPTVARTEAGERPVKLSEAFSIAAILNASFEGMTQDLSLPFAYDNLIDQASRRHPKSYSERARLAERVSAMDVEEIGNAIDDYERACERFGAKPLVELVKYAKKRKKHLQRISNFFAMDAHRIEWEILPNTDDEADFPKNHHGERTWLKGFEEQEED